MQGEEERKRRRVEDGDRNEKRGVERKDGGGGEKGSEGMWRTGAGENVQRRFILPTIANHHLG